MGKQKVYKASQGGGKRGAMAGGQQTAVRTLLTANTTLGQHFLKNPAVVESICQKANLRSSDVTLEVGPGTGNLTVRLLELSKKVVAVEFDHRMVREVLKRVEGTSNEHNLQVIQGDVLKVDIPPFDVCVANLPYQISSPFLFKMLEHTPAFRCAVIMFQLEFAQRLVAKPGDDLYCRLTVNTQLLARVESVLKVGKANFRPPPKVDSMVVRIEIRKPRPAVDFKEWDGLIRLLFNRKNKTIRSLLCQKQTLAMLEENVKTHRALTTGTGASGTSPGVVAMEDGSSLDIKAMVEDVLTAEGYGDKRAAKLDINDFLCLLAAFNIKGIHFA